MVGDLYDVIRRIRRISTLRVHPRQYSTSAIFTIPEFKRLFLLLCFARFYGEPGVKHRTVTCDGCKENPLCGKRWKCADCSDFDLCSICYNDGKHDLNHEFNRIDEEGGEPVAVGRRYGAPRQNAYGFFPGSSVKRGIDWDWENQDGGDGKVGEITQFYDWQFLLETFRRSAVAVKWKETGSSHNYRIGYEGKIDLVCTKAVRGGHYYKDHLPKFDMKTSVSAKEEKLSVGDKVVITLDAEIVEAMQTGHGEWNLDMKETTVLSTHHAYHDKAPRY